MRIAVWQTSTAEQQRKLLARPALAKDATVAASVASIIERVRREGDPALLDLTAKLRSEEHTSELQSQSNLVCRLLLEKKKNTDTASSHQRSIAYFQFAPADLHRHLPLLAREHGYCSLHHLPQTLPPLALSCLRPWPHC